MILDNTILSLIPPEMLGIELDSDHLFCQQEPHFFIGPGEGIGKLFEGEEAMDQMPYKLYQKRKRIEDVTNQKRVKLNLRSYPGQIWKEIKAAVQIETIRRAYQI